MSAAFLAQAAANPQVQNIAKGVAGKASDKITGAALGGIGGALFGRKGKRVGKKIARGLGKVRKSLLGFNEGGKVRKVPMMVQGYNAGGVIVRPLPMVRPRRPRRQ